MKITAIIILVILSFAVFAAPPPPPPAPEPMGGSNTQNNNAEDLPPEPTPIGEDLPPEPTLINQNQLQQPETQQQQNIPLPPPAPAPIGQSNNQERQPAVVSAVSSDNYLVILLITNLLTFGLLIVISYLHFSKPKIKANPQLTNYIKSVLAMGYTEDQVKQNLIQYNYKEEDINACFKEIHK